MAKLHVRQFLEQFVRPLVAGGDVHIGAPISEPDVYRMDSELGDASVELVAVDDARTAALSTLFCRPPAFVLEGEDLMLAAGLHNALFLVHPRADVWTVTDKQRRRIVDASLAQVSQPLTRDRTRVIARHGLLHNLFRLTRHDTTVTWWTGRARFHGQRAPQRLLRWRGMRRVREDVTTVDFNELLAVPDTAPVVATLVRRTPLTQLLDSHPGAPALHWEDAVFVLRDAELARTVAHELVPDASPRDQVAGPARLAAAFEQMLERAPDERDVRAVASFLVYFSAMFALAEIGLRESGAKSPLLSTVLAVEAAAHRPRGLATLFALPAALAQVDSRLATPPGIAAIPQLAARWRVHRAQAAELIGEPVVDALATRLRRHIRSIPTSIVDDFVIER